MAEPEPQPQSSNVEEFVPEVAYEAPETDRVRYNGRRTRFRAAYTMLRNQEILVPGDTFEVAAYYDKALKRWIGPEAAHVEHLMALGQVAGTKEAEQRARLQAAIEHERGVHPTRDDPIGRPDLAPYTPEQVRKQWARVLVGGQVEISRAERQNARSGDAAVDTLAQQLATLLQGAAQHAGSAAPGTFPVDQ